MTQTEMQSMLSEILLKPSQELVAERFSVESQAAPCSGACQSSGTCMGSK